MDDFLSRFISFLLSRERILQAQREERRAELCSIQCIPKLKSVGLDTDTFSLDSTCAHSDNDLTSITFCSLCPQLQSFSSEQRIRIRSNATNAPSFCHESSDVGKTRRSTNENLMFETVLFPQFNVISIE